MLSGFDRSTILLYIYRSIGAITFSLLKKVNKNVCWLLLLLLVRRLLTLGKANMNLFAHLTLTPTANVSLTQHFDIVCTHNYYSLLSLVSGRIDSFLAAIFSVHRP